jgi:Predicted membrane protein (DUF2306)
VTQSTSGLISGQPGHGEPDRGGSARPDHAGGHRRFRPWLVVLTIVVIAWLGIFVVPTYITLDPGRTPIGLLKGSRVHYPVVVAHVAGGLVAMLAGCLQMWPWLRQAHPRVHRTVGRIYAGAVFVAAPAALALVILGNLRDGPRFDTYLNAFAVGSTIWAVLWFGTTARGLFLARRRRFVDHRRMMVYSFALTVAIMYSRPLLIVAYTNALPIFNFAAYFENIGWLPWVANLLIAQWWLNRTARRPLALPPSVVPAQPELTPAPRVPA